MALNSLQWLVAATLFGISLPVMAMEYEEDIILPEEPAMADIVEPQTLNDIRDIMIKESIQKNGFCACPYSTDALGGQCGTLSAYFFPWNKILCYRRDISNDMIYFYRLERATNAYQAQLNQREAERIAAEEAAKSPEQKAEEAKKKQAITADYFRNSAKPLPNTITLPSNISLPAQDLSTEEEDLTSGYFTRTVPVTPASNMPGLTNLIAPPVPIGP